jgi:hypothetical protein
MTILWSKNVDSSVIQNIVYDTSESALVVHFRTGSVWVYLNVDLEVYDALMSSQSVGQYFNKHIRNVYSSQKFTLDQKETFLKGKVFGEET